MSKITKTLEHKTLVLRNSFTQNKRTKAVVNKSFKKSLFNCNAFLFYQNCDRSYKNGKLLKGLNHFIYAVLQLNCSVVVFQLIKADKSLCNSIRINLSTNYQHKNTKSATAVETQLLKLG